MRNQLPRQRKEAGRRKKPKKKNDKAERQKKGDESSIIPGKAFGFFRPKKEGGQRTIQWGRDKAAFFGGFQNDFQ